jgi:hypothetical protein
VGLGSLKRKLKEAAVSKILALLVSKLAEGDFGTTASKVYWKLAGLKTYTAIAFGAVGYALTRASDAGICEPCGELAAGLMTFAGFLLTIGLYDGAIRSQPPTKPLTTVRVPPSWPSY